MKYILNSLLLLAFSVVICCVLYPLALWIVGQAFFHFQANGSMLFDSNNKLIGSSLIAQPFTKDEYFHPRPSAASYNAAASSSSSLAPSNYALRDRVARSLAQIVTYKTGPKAGKSIAPDIEQWFREDTFQGKPHIVAQWASLHNSLAQAWVNADPANEAFINRWTKENQPLVDQFIKDNPSLPNPKAADLAVLFFQNFSQTHPGEFPSTKGVNSESIIPSLFFDMWLQEHPIIAVDLVHVPADMVTTSASGLDPHISLENAKFQLDRVAGKWASYLNRDPHEVKAEIEQMLEDNAYAPFAGLAGEKHVNVLKINLALHNGSL